MERQTLITILIVVLVIIYFMQKKEHFRYYDSNIQRRTMLDNQPAQGFLLDTSAPGR